MTTRFNWPSIWKHDDDGPRAQLMSLRHEIDRAFESFGRSIPEIAWPGEGFAPRLDVSERDGALEVEAELPGVDPAGVEITLEGDLLTIAGEKKTERERAEGGVARIRERSWGAFSRAIRLPFEPEEKGVEAMFANGVLKVTMKIPEGAHAAPKRIAVKAA